MGNAFKIATRNTDRIPGIIYTEEDNDPFQVEEDTNEDPIVGNFPLETSEEVEPEPKQKPIRVGPIEPTVTFNTRTGRVI